MEKGIRSTAPDGFARYDQAELGGSLTSFRAFFKEVCDCGGVGILFREEIRSTRGLCPLGRYDKGDSIATLAMTKKLGYKNFRDCAYLTLRKVSADSKMILQAVLRLLFRFLSLRSTVRSALFGYSFAYWRITAFSGGFAQPIGCFWGLYRLAAAKLSFEAVLQSFLAFFKFAFDCAG